MESNGCLTILSAESNFPVQVLFKLQDKNLDQIRLCDYLVSLGYLYKSSVSTKRQEYQGRGYYDLFAKMMPPTRRLSLDNYVQESWKLMFEAEDAINNKISAGKSKSKKTKNSGFCLNGPGLKFVTTLDKALERLQKVQLNLLEIERTTSQNSLLKAVGGEIEYLKNFHPEDLVIVSYAQ